jgi:CheY-like chemotaxis protein
MSKTSPQEFGSLVVLIVEDEFFLRCNLADCLRDAGWVVMEAANADDAMAVLANRWEGLLQARQPRNADTDPVQKFSFQRLRLARLAKRRRAALAPSRH